MTHLPGGWEWTTLDEVTDPARPICYGILMPKEHDPAGVPYVKVRDFPSGAIDVASLQRTAPAIAEKYRRSSLRSRDVLVSIRGTYGRVALVPPGLEGGNITQDTARIAPVTGVLPEFVAYFLRSELAQSYFKAVARGVAVKGVNIGDLRLLRMPLPPLTEQKRIVAAIEEHFPRLEAAEAAIASAAARLRTHERALVAHRFADRNWNWTTLGAIADLKGGVTKDAKRQGDPSFVGVPYLRVANVQRGRLDLNEVASIRVDKAKAEKLRLQPGDMLFNEGGDRDKLGRGWVWEGQIEDCIHQNHVFRGRLITDDFDPYFVSTHANTWGQAWFEEHGRQTTNLASISLSTLKQLPVPVAPIAEQRAIVTELGDATEARARLATALTQARARAVALRRSILAAAFSGRLVAQDSSDESAAVLLERIRAERGAAGPSKRARKAKSA